MAVQLGWIDTNVFVHAIMLGDPHQPRCRDLVAAMEDGRAEGWVTIAVIHELSYVLARVPTLATRGATAAYVTTILGYPGVLASDKEQLIATVARWAAGRMGFVDALLAELAQRGALPVCSVNARDFPATPNTFATAALDQAAGS